MYLGDFAEDTTLYFTWNTFDASGASVTRATNGTVKVYKDNATGTETVTGVTDGEDHDGQTGMHLCTIDLSADAFYATGADYHVMVDGMIVDGRTVNARIAEFSIENRFNNVGQIAAISGVAKRAPESYVLTTGTQSANTVSVVEELDGVRHEHTDDGGAMDLYYQFNIASGLATEVKMTGYLQGMNDDLEVYGFDWVSVGWKQIGVLNGQASASNGIHSYDLLVDMVGSGANLGLVRVRFTDGAFTLTTAILAIDQILVEFSQGAEGYENGAVWLDTNASNTNTVRGVDGIPSNPVSTIGAVNTLLTSTSLSRVEVAPQSSFTFAATQANQSFFGKNWTLALGGRSVSGSYFEGAHISGIGTGAAEVHFSHCHFANVTLPPSDCEECVLEGTFTIGTAGDFKFERCASGVAGTSTPVLDFGGALNSSDVNFRDYSGGIEIQNMGAGTGTYDMSLEGDGQLIINSNCSATSNIAIRGNFDLTNNASGMTITQTARYNVSQATGSVTGNVDGTVAGMTAGMKAEVKVEAVAALADINLNHLMKDAESSDVTTDSALAKLAASDGVWNGFDKTTDSQEALRDLMETLPSSGSGAFTVNHDKPTTDALAFLTSGAVGIDNAVVRAFLKTDYDANSRADSDAKGITTTNTDGGWTNDIMLDAGTYTIEFFKQGLYGPDTQEITVGATGTVTLL